MKALGWLDPPLPRLWVRFRRLENLLMNGRASVVRLFLLSLGWVVVLGVAHGVSAAMIDASVKSSGDGATVRAAVVPFIQEQVANLQKDDSAVQTAARDALTSEASGGPQRTPTSTYLDNYSDEVNKALLPVMENPNMNVRLNAAIAAARIAQTAQTVRFADLAAKAMQDKMDPVVLWGFHIARYTIPAISVNKGAVGNDKLVPLVVQYVTEHPSGIISQYAYDAVSLDLIETNRTRPWTDDQWNLALVHVIPAIQQIFKVRLDKYQTGIPEDPQKERRPVLVLTQPRAWNAQTLEQRTKTMQLLVDLMSFASQRAVNAKDVETRNQLIDLIKYVAGALQASGAQNGMPKLGEAAQGVVTLPRNVTGDQAAAAVQASVQKIRAIPNLEQVKLPPVVRAVAVEIKPTSGPSTEPSILPASATQPVGGGAGAAAGGNATTRPATQPAGAANTPAPAPAKKP